MNTILTKIAVEAQVEHCISHVRLQKFAELIIAECISAHEDNYGGDIIGDVLKEHFGVEE